MAGPSDPPPPHVSLRIQDLNYFNALNTNVSNFVSVKLSGYDNYHCWKRQMLLLMEAHSIRSLVDASFDRSSSTEIMKQYDRLLMGWIFGSISQEVLGNVVILDSAKEVWHTLESFYDPKQETESETETKDKDMISEIEDRGRIREAAQKSINDRLEVAVKKGKWRSAIYEVYNNRVPLNLRAIDKEGNTVLHLAIEKGQNYFVDQFLAYLDDKLHDEEVKDVLEMKNVTGNTALHVAASVGNTHVAELLVEKNEYLLTILDNQHKDPLYKASSNVQFDTFLYLLKVVKKKLGNISQEVIEMGYGLLVIAIAAKEYSTASKLVKEFPELERAREYGQVLMAIARTFPSGPRHEETLECPDLGDLGKGFIGFIEAFFWVLSTAAFCRDGVPLGLYRWFCVVIFCLMWIVFISLFMLYCPLWKGATKLVSSMKPIKKEWKDAKELLELVCNKIDTLDSGTRGRYYEGPLLEAACQNAHEVVDEILLRSPEAKDSCGYNIIQLAVIHRSNEIYNRVYQKEDKVQYYKTIKDSSENNLLHLAGRLAPSYKLNRITGAALQLQRELQWREELKTFVFPACISQVNIYKETPGVVFTREHGNLLKEGEKWMKTTAESCSITAGLITTIVFAAAITVPGGNNQEKGIPLFSNEIAFIIFAISDAVSLFTSTITLLVFLSILTARFSEQDFLISLPRRLIIGLCTLLVSTTAMMVAFGATLFLVFCQKKPWMLVPICASVCLTIVFAFIIQIPLIVDLCRSTYVPIFHKKKIGGFRSSVIEEIVRWKET